MLPPSPFADARDPMLDQLGKDQAAMAQGGGAAKLLGAVSTLLALTPKGRTEELTRLTALAHGYVSLVDEDELVPLAKAIANRDDVSHGLADRLAETSARAAHILIRADRLSEEAIAFLLERGDEEMRTLIARHHSLQPKHITMLVAGGKAAVLQALLANQLSDLSPATKASLQTQILAQDKVEPQKRPEQERSEQEHPGPVMQPSAPLAMLSAPQNRSFGGDPKRSAADFANLDSAGRRAVVRRLAEDSPAPKKVSMADARRALDPTRHDADLAFLSVVEQRDSGKLAALFAQTLQMDEALVRQLMDEAEGDSLMLLARAAGLSSTAFARMLVVGKVGLTGSPRDTFALVDRFKALPEATAAMIISAMRGGEASAPMPTKSLPNQQRRAPAARSILSVAEGPAAAKPQGWRRTG